MALLFFIYSIITVFHLQYYYHIFLRIKIKWIYCSEEYSSDHIFYHNPLMFTVKYCIYILQYLTVHITVKYC